MLDNKAISLMLILFLAISIIGAAALSSGPMNSENGIINEILVVNDDNIFQQSNNASINAKIDIDPDTLNLKSNGKWITCYIELPAGYNASNINASTVRLNNNLTPVLDRKYGFVKDQDGYLIDHDENNITEHMLKFSRAAVQSILMPGEGVNITITGRLYDNTSFSGNDTIRVINPPKMKIKIEKPKNNETDDSSNHQNNKNKDKHKQKNDDNDTINETKDGNDTIPNNNNATNINATIKIVPVTINLKSEGNWITCIIELPSGYNVSHINASSVLLEGNLSPVLDPKYGFVSNESEYISDDDNDGNKERMFKFDRQKVQELLSDVENKETVELTITGKVNSTTFTGSDTVKVINKK
jgi:hypothetical protein